MCLDPYNVHSKRLILLIYSDVGFYKLNIWILDSYWISRLFTRNINQTPSAVPKRVAVLSLSKQTQPLF